MQCPMENAHLGCFSDYFYLELLYCQFALLKD